MQVLLHHSWCPFWRNCASCPNESEPHLSLWRRGPSWTIQKARRLWLEWPPLITLWWSSCTWLLQSLILILSHLTLAGKHHQDDDCSDSKAHSRRKNCRQDQMPFSPIVTPQFHTEQHLWPSFIPLRLFCKNNSFCVCSTSKLNFICTNLHRYDCRSAITPTLHGE